MSIQNITLVATVKKSEVENLRIVLQKLKNNLLENKTIGLEKTNSIHFARWIILEEYISGNGTLPTMLAFTSNFDGSIQQHLYDLCEKTGGLIDDVYKHCIGYPTTSTADKVAYLTSLSMNCQAFYPGAPGRTLQDINQENELRNTIHQFLSSRSWTGKSAQEVHRAVKEHILQNNEYTWAKEKTKLPSMNWPGLFLFGIILIPLVPLLLLWIIILQLLHERKDLPLGLTPSQIDEKHQKKMESYEDFTLQNQFSQILEVKLGKMRLFTLKGVLFITKILVKIAFVKGKLMGIPTIHYARWVLIDNNQRLLFCSNYDGSWQQYLGDFIDKSGWGLTGIFSNSVGFPRSKFLFFKGAYDEEHFLAWSRYYQIETQVWYSAYPKLSIKNINNNSQIRSELFKKLNEKRSQRFLARI
jgi:hypothetical protein